MEINCKLKIGEPKKLMGRQRPKWYEIDEGQLIGDNKGSGSMEEIVENAKILTKCLMKNVLYY